MIEVEYRLVPTDGAESQPWTSVPNVQAGRETRIDGLIEGEAYEVRARISNQDGTTTAWTYSAPAIARTGSQVGGTGEEVAPAPPQNLRVEDDGCLHWDHPFAPAAAVDVVGYEVRTAPDDFRDFDAAQPLHEQLITSPQFDLCAAPRGVRTFLVVAVLANGVKSEPALAIVDLGPYDEALSVQIETHAENPSWPGTKVNCTPSGGALVQATADTYYGPDAAPYYGADADAYYANRRLEATYTVAILPAAAPPTGAAWDEQILTIAPVVAGAPGWHAQYRRADSP